MGVGAAQDRVAETEPVRQWLVLVVGGAVQRLRRRLERWGVPGVSLLGQPVLPSQITSAALATAGLSVVGS